jgi:uncharacterized lipoprotein YajG
MKNTLTILLSGLLLCGCSQKQGSSSGSAIDRIQAGQDTAFGDSVVLHVAKRDGTSLEGVSISAKLPNGQTQTLTADTATLSAVTNTPGVVEWIVTLHGAKSDGTVVGELPIGLGK